MKLFKSTTMVVERVESSAIQSESLIKFMQIEKL